MRCNCVAATWLAVAGVGLLSLPVAALAEVTMETSVAKVETTIDAAGRVKRQLLPAESVLPGEELRYAITFTNSSDTLVEGGRIIITNAIPEGARYVSGTAGGQSARVEYSADGEVFEPVEPASAASRPTRTAGGDAPGQGSLSDAVASLRWSYDADLAPGQSGEVYFHVRMQ
jgi:uncharacterized repeat protein (TIGR01451 family)